MNHQVNNNASHECLKFSHNSMLKCMLKINSFDSICEKCEGAEMSLDVERSRFSSHNSQVTCGNKIVDRRH